jgi:hypothetical protein
VTPDNTIHGGSFEQLLLGGAGDIGEPVGQIPAVAGPDPRALDADDDAAVAI